MGARSAFSRQKPPLILCGMRACAPAGNYIDHKCPFTGNVSIRGRILSGKVRRWRQGGGLRGAVYGALG